MKIIIGFILFVCYAQTDFESLLFGILALLVIILGSLFSWIGSFFTYGFGEIVDNVCNNGYEIQKNAETSFKTNKKTENNKSELVSKKQKKLEELEKLYSQGLINEFEYYQAKVNLK